MIYNSVLKVLLQVKAPSPPCSSRTSIVSARSSAAVAKIESELAQTEEIKVRIK